MENAGERESVVRPNARITYGRARAPGPGTPPDPQRDVGQAAAAELKPVRSIEVTIRAGQLRCVRDLVPFPGVAVGEILEAMKTDIAFRNIMNPRGALQSVQEGTVRRLARYSTVALFSIGGRIESATLWYPDGSAKELTGASISGTDVELLAP